MAKDRTKKIEDNDELEKEKSITKKQKITSAKKRARKRLREKVLKISILIVVLFLINLYIILGIFYRDGGFTVSLDYEEGKDPNLLIYESLSDKTQKTYLKCEDLEYFFSDISIDWLPDDIHGEAEGSHNGLYYYAYSFYCENNGKETINYWTTAEIDSMEKNVDDALRFAVYLNDEPRRVYAKRATNGNPEPGTIPFKDENTMLLEQRKNLKPGDIDKYTIVVFLEGDDPQCIDDLIGGQISMHMRITEEHITNQEEPKIQFQDYEPKKIENKEENAIAEDDQTENN